ncbi:MAG: type VI secretion system protein ImpL, partial [Chloroflexota bacterium]
FWNLLSGPYTYLWAYTRMETACYLQSQWDEKVLAEALGAAGPQVTQILLGQDGYVWKFIKGPAAPFVGKSLQRGYASREVLGGAIPFESGFYSFLSRGARIQTQSATQAQAKESYPVSVKGLPTDVNPEAKLKPHATRLELQCATGSQSLINLNYPVSKTFNWAPESCGNVVFQIEVGDVVLVKKYLGPHGFPDFLQDFKAGQRVFYPQDFPVERQALERLGIKHIRAHYLITGAQAILGQTRVAPGQAPRSIARCWDR